MVGEIRDAETAQIAVQAALTGHQVFATVHANNVFDVIGRLATMQVDSYNLVSALNGVLAQRLIRQLCTHCAAPRRRTGAAAPAWRCPRPQAAGASWAQWAARTAAAPATAAVAPSHRRWRWTSTCAA